MSKRFIAFFMSAVMCLSLCSLAGCGEEETLSTYTEEEVIGTDVIDNSSDNVSSENTSSSTNSDKTSSQNKTKTGSKKGVSDSERNIFENIPKELKGTTVTFATWFDHPSLSTGHVFSDFEDLTGIKVKIVNVTQADYIVKLTGMKASGTIPDIIIENGDFPRTLSLLQPITEAKTGINPKDSFWNQEVTQRYTINGKVYAVNGANSFWECGCSLIYYNIALLKSHGIKNPQDYIKENNWNLETFYKIASDCKNAGLNGAAIDNLTFSHVYAGGPAAYNTSTAKFSNAMNTTKFQQAWEWLLKGKEQGVFNIYNTWAQGFGDNRTGMAMTGGYGMRNKPGWFCELNFDDIGYAYLPKINKNDANYPTTAESRGYGISSDAKNPKGAGYFLRYFLNMDWYNNGTIFKDSRAEQMFKDLRKLSGINYAPDGVVTVQYKDWNEFYSDLSQSTPEQVKTNIDKVSKKLDYCITKSNSLIDKAR